MRLLVDANLSPKIAVALNKAGLESVHVGDAGLLTAPDRTILEYAAANDCKLLLRCTHAVLRIDALLPRLPTFPSRAQAKICSGVLCLD